MGARRSTVRLLPWPVQSSAGPVALQSSAGPVALQSSAGPVALAQLLSVAEVWPRPNGFADARH